MLERGKNETKRRVVSLNEDQVTLNVILSNVTPLNKFLLNHIYIYTYIMQLISHLFLLNFLQEYCKNILCCKHFL